MLHLLDDGLLAFLLVPASVSSLQALCVTNRRLHDAITAESFLVARIRMGITAVEVCLDAKQGKDEDCDSDEGGFEQDEEEDDDYLGNPGEDNRAIRNFGGSILVDGVQAGRFQCNLVERGYCVANASFLTVCDMESQELVDVGRLLFNQKGLPRSAALQADDAITCYGGFLYISEFTVSSVTKMVPAAVLAFAAPLAIKKLLSMPELCHRWDVAAYIGDGRQRSDASCTSIPFDTDAAAFTSRQIDDCRPFVSASFDEIEHNAGWLFTTQGRLRGGDIRRTPLRAGAPPDQMCSAVPTGPDKLLLDHVLKIPSMKIGAGTEVPGWDQLVTQYTQMVGGMLSAYAAGGASVDRSHALHAAAARREPLLMAALVQHGASVDARDSDGHTPLMLAAMNVNYGYHQDLNPNDDTACVDALLALGADVSLTSPRGCSALGCYRQKMRDSNDFNATFAGIGHEQRGANPAVEASLLPPAGPTAADAALALHGSVL
jgi:hypothetical protein